MRAKRDDSERLNLTETRTLLGPGARFSGKLVFEEGVRIEGRFEGEIQTNDLLVVAPTAEVRANMRVGNIVITGMVEGDIVATNLIVIQKEGKVRGNLVTSALVIEQGAVFDGSTRMSQDPQKSAAPAPASAKPTGGKASGERKR